MHGVKRGHVFVDANEKAVKLVSQRESYFKAKEGAVPENVLAESEKLLLMNSEVYTAWASRRKAFAELEAKDGFDALLDKDLKLTLECLQRDPKSYWVWFHRKWVTELKMARSIAPGSICIVQTEAGPVLTPRSFEEKKANAECVALARKELEKCNLLLERDDRNFHCWNYRANFVFSLSQKEDLAYTWKRIEANINNYSAFHRRTFLLKEVSDEMGERERGEKERVHRCGRKHLDAEIELVEQAISTLPENSSAWFYYQWLIDSLSVPDSSSLSPEERERAKDNERELVLREIARMDAFLTEIAPDCRGAKLAKASLLERVPGREQEAKEIYLVLCSEDPLRKGFYAHLASKI